MIFVSKFGFRSPFIFEFKPPLSQTPNEAFQQTSGSGIKISSGFSIFGILNIKGYYSATPDTIVTICPSFGAFILLSQLFFLIIADCSRTHVVTQNITTRMSNSIGRTI